VWRGTTASLVGHRIAPNTGDKRIGSCYAKNSDQPAGRRRLLSTGTGVAITRTRTQHVSRTVRRLTNARQAVGFSTVGYQPGHPCRDTSRWASCACTATRRAAGATATNVGSDNTAGFCSKSTWIDRQHGRRNCVPGWSRRLSRACHDLQLTTLAAFAPVGTPWR